MAAMSAQTSEKVFLNSKRLTSVLQGTYMVTAAWEWSSVASAVAGITVPVLASPTIVCKHFPAVPLVTTKC